MWQFTPRSRRQRSERPSHRRPEEANMADRVLGAGLPSHVPLWAAIVALMPEGCLKSGGSGFFFGSSSICTRRPFKYAPIYLAETPALSAEMFREMLRCEAKSRIHLFIWVRFAISRRLLAQDSQHVFVELLSVFFFHTIPL